MFSPRTYRKNNFCEGPLSAISGTDWIISLNTKLKGTLLYGQACKTQNENSKEENTNAGKGKGKGQDLKTEIKSNRVKNIKYSRYKLKYLDDMLVRLNSQIWMLQETKFKPNKRIEFIDDFQVFYLSKNFFALGWLRI